MLHRYIAMAVTALSLLSARAQTNTIGTPTLPPGNAPGLTLTNAPAGVQDFFTRAFGVHDPTKEYFASANEFEAEFGASYNAVHGGVDQSTAVDYWHRISPTSEIGADFEADSLGAAGQDLDLLAVHANYRLDWDNVAGGFSAGGFRDFAGNSWGGEAGIFGEYRLTPGVGTFLRYYLDFDSASSKKVGGRLIFGVTIALGK